MLFLVQWHRNCNLTVFQSKHFLLFNRDSASNVTQLSLQTIFLYVCLCRPDISVVASRWRYLKNEIRLSLTSRFLTYTWKIVCFVRLPYSFRMAEYDVAVFSWLVSLYFCINALSFQAVFVSKAICLYHCRKGTSGICGQIMGDCSGNGLQIKWDVKINILKEFWEVYFKLI